MVLGEGKTPTKPTVELHMVTTAWLSDESTLAELEVARELPGDGMSVYDRNKDTSKSYLLLYMIGLESKRQPTLCVWEMPRQAGR